MAIDMASRFVAELWCRLDNRRNQHRLTPKVFCEAEVIETCLCSCADCLCQRPASQSALGVFFGPDRSGRVSNEPMFRAATKKTECAFEDGAASLIAGTGTNGQQGKHSVRPTLRAPGRGMRYYGGDAARQFKRTV